MSEVYFLTIFGYSAPGSDTAAQELLQAAWNKNPRKTIAQIEIIDIAEEEELERKWNPFFTRDHYGIFSTINSSWIMQYGRRSCDALFQATMMNAPIEECPVPDTNELETL